MTAVTYGREVAVGQARERRSLPAVLRHLDYVLVASTMALALIGVVMVYTATHDQPGGSRHYVELQAVWVVIGLAVMLALAWLDYRRLRQWGYVIYGLVILSLLGVFVVGKSAQGQDVSRWYQFGPIQLQPSEFAVLGLAIAVATYCSRRKGVLGLREMVGLFLLAGVPMVLVYKQPDLGTTIILGVALAALMLAADIRIRYLLVLFALVVGAFFVALELHLLHTYQLDRLTSFLHQSRGAESTNYELDNARNAVASGGLKGTGLDRGLATNLALIPNQQTDFIFSAIGEQLGFIGSAIVVGLFGIVAFRMLRAAQMAKDSFGRLICVGCAAFLAFSVFENIGMNIGIMPITGIPLPFISYGGSACVAFFAAVGLTISVQLRRELRR